MQMHIYLCNLKDIRRYTSLYYTTILVLSASSSQGFHSDFTDQTLFHNVQLLFNFLTVSSKIFEVATIESSNSYYSSSLTRSQYSSRQIRVCKFIYYQSLESVQYYGFFIYVLYMFFMQFIYFFYKILFPKASADR